MSDELKQARADAIRVASKTLAELLASDDAALELLADEQPLPSRDGYLRLLHQAHDHAGLGGLRKHKRRLVLAIAARDLCGESDLDAVGRALADLADACLEVTLNAIEAPDGFGVVGMGKLGGQELNYFSDIDVMFVAEGEFQLSTKAAESLLQALGAPGPESQAYRIDVNLRPEGRSGALVRSLEGYLEYYRRWAQPWEHQALIKARAATGADAARALVEATRPIVFPTEVPAERIAGIRKMKERLEGHVARSSRRGRSREADDVKLGPGGIRDIEFAVQLLQLVHGGNDVSVRGGNTLETISALVDGGYVAEEDAAGLGVAYRWLRTVEHRLQLYQERQVHHLPVDPEQRANLARVLGFEDSIESTAVASFENKHRGVIADVRGRFEKLFYRPMIETLADAPGPRLSPEALKERLRVLGFRDVDRATRTLDGLVSGTSRRAKLVRVLTPPLLRFLAVSPSPDVGLLSFLRLVEALHGRLDALGALRDNPPGLAFLARVIGSGKLLGDVLVHVPEELATIAAADPAAGPKNRDRLVREARASLEWRAPTERLDGLRRFKRREMLRIALADLADQRDASQVGASLSDLADACLEAALEEASLPFAVVGMGKLGGRELQYASDLDVMFVHDADAETAETTAEGLLKAIGEVTPEGQAFRIDPGLRPEGKAGPLCRSFAAYIEYYERWSAPWEHQALLKARVCAGDAELGQRLVRATRRFAYPPRLSETALREIRHLKARMERERIPRGVDPQSHIKLGPGGMSDVEFTAQILQLRHARDIAELQVTGTIEALEGAWKAGLIDEQDARRLLDAYAFLCRLRNRLFFLTARPTDVLPKRPEDLEALAISLGYSDQPRQELDEHYRRMTRRARRVAERLIYG